MTEGNAWGKRSAYSELVLLATEVLALLVLDLHGALHACVPGGQIRLWLAPVRGVGSGEWKKEGTQTGSGSWGVTGMELKCVCVYTLCKQSLCCTPLLLISMGFFKAMISKPGLFNLSDHTWAED